MGKQTLVGGLFEAAGGLAGSGVAFFSPAGELLATATPGLFDSAFPGTVSQVYPEAARVVVIGAFTSPQSFMARLLPDGSNDATFAPNIGGGVTQVIRDGTGYIIIGGFATVGGSPRDRIARILEDGTLDAAWNPTVPGTGAIYAAAAHAGGVVVVRGDTLSRITAAGVADAAFTNRVLTPGVTSGITVQPDGKIIVCGTFTAVDGGSPVLGITRLLASGANDPAWVGPTSDADWIDWSAQEVLRASDGTLYVRLQSGVYNRLKKLSGADGSTIAWTHGGVDLWQQVTIAPNDDVLAWTSNGTTYRHLRRWDASGAAIAGWDSAVGAEATAAGQTANIIALADGSAVSGGSATSMAGVALSGVVRKRADGSIDPDFRGGLSELVCNAVGQLADGTIVVAGKFAGAGATRVSGLALVDESGVVADWYAPELTLVGVAGFPSVEAVALHGNRGYIGGFFSRFTSRGQSKDMGSLARLLPNGDPDPAFTDPYVRANTVIGTVRGFAIDPAGKIVATGNFNRIGPLAVANNCGNVAWFNADGSPDPISYAAPQLNANGYCALFQPDGKTLVGGVFTTVGGVAMAGVVRYNADGTRDTGWANPAANVTGTTRIVKRMALQPDGKVLIAGSFTSVGGSSSPGIARLNADGTRDAGFTTSVTGATECVALAADGSIFVGGNGAVAKMNADGTPAEWANPFVSGDVIRNIQIEEDGTLLVSGAFERDGYASLARLLPSGAIDTTFPKAAFFAVPRFGTPVALARAETPPMEMTLGQQSLARFETRPGVIRFNVYGGVPPYTLRVRGRAPDGLAVNGMALEGTFSRPGRYVWDVVAADAAGAELAERLDMRVNPLELPYGALLFVASPARVRRVDWEGGSDTELLAGNNLVQTAARLRNGQIVVGGTFSQFGGKNPLHRVMRLNADGTRDLAWPGLAASNTILGTISCFGEQSTGKVLVGARTEFSTFTGAVIRLNTDGTLDATFSLTGGPTPGPRIHAMRVLPDDRILFGGGGGGTDWQNPIVFRTSANGAIDTAFLNAFPGGASVTARFNTLSSGLWTSNESLNGTPSVPSNRAVWSLDLMVDGKIVVGGGFAGRRINAATSVADRLDFVGADGGHATPGFRALLSTPAYLNSVCVFRVFPNPDGSVTAIGNFTARGGTALDTGLAVVGADGSLIAGAVGSGTSAPILDFASRLPDGRFYATHSAVSGKAVRLFPDGVVDTSFVSPAHQVAAILPDDNGVSGFTADGLVGVTVEGEAENPDPPDPPAPPFVGDGAIYLFGINQGGGSVDTAVIREQLRLSMTPAPLPVSVSRDRLAAGVAGLPMYEGTAATSDAIAFADDPAWQVFKLVQETVVLRAAGTPEFTAMVRVIEHLLLSGRARHLAEAVAMVTDALVLHALDDAFQVGAAADRLLMGDNIASVYAQVAEIVERVLLSAGAAPSYTAMVVVRESLVLSASGAPTELEVVALIREAIGFAANLTIDNGEYVAWVLNTESKGLTRYTQYPFNSFARIGGRYMGCSADGLHWLDGDTDNGEEIHARIRLGLSAMGTRRLKRVPDCFIGYTSSGVLLLKAIVTDEDGGLNAAIYRLRPRPAGNLRENLFKPGRGLKAVDWDFEIENVDGGDFELSSIEFRPLILDRRTRG